MKEFALTDNEIAYYGHIYCYVKGDNEKDVLKEWISDDNNYENCKIIRKPKNVNLKYGAEYCFEYKGKYYYAYEVTE